ncbi:MAG: MBL fold metallo-hydrolase [Verrucomicrobiae bacterium]|nr:MBL fold metallo-hydrolase [Verrucomicrobiae bacterium]MCP5523456.1 MBL fold metallo-hydrolase [Verrucomicrobiales bacterium]
MIKPRLQDDAFLADVEEARNHPAALHVWWLGQSGFLVQWQDRHLLLDPYLSDSLTRKYAATDKPHVRMTERVIAPERLDFIDVVTSSHNHTDHLDAETLRALARMNPRLRLVCARANLPVAAERSGFEDDSIVDLDPEAEPVTARVRGFRISAVPAAHERIERNHAGLQCFVGFVVEAGPWRLYHSGDTVLYPELEARLRPYRVHLALLPINGRAPERRVAGNLWGREAARLAQDIGAELAVPCHFDMFEFNTASPEEFVTRCDALGQPCRVLQAGERLTLGDQR